GGANAGSDYNLARYADDGVTLLGTSLAITRSTGVATFETTPKVGSNSVAHAGNFATFPAGDSPGVGEIRMWDGTSDPVAPSGSSVVWMICDGRLINRTTYAAYFALVGTRYSAGDGSTIFGIRDMTGLAPVGKEASPTRLPHNASSTMGAIFGEERHTMT